MDNFIHKRQVASHDIITLMENGTYKTTDLGLAAALQTDGHFLISVEPANEGKENQMTFIFNAKDTAEMMQLKQFEEDYFTHKMRLDPYEFFFREKDLRALIRMRSRN